MVFHGDKIKFLFFSLSIKFLKEKIKTKSNIEKHIFTTENQILKKKSKSIILQST